MTPLAACLSPEGLEDAVAVAAKATVDDLSPDLRQRAAVSPGHAARRATPSRIALSNGTAARTAKTSVSASTPWQEQIAALDDSDESLRLMAVRSRGDSSNGRISLRAQQQENSSIRARCSHSAPSLSCGRAPPCSPPRRASRPHLLNAALAAVFTFFFVYGMPS
jgi:hypothetical protein